MYFNYVSLVVETNDEEKESEEGFVTWRAILTKQRLTKKWEREARKCFKKQQKLLRDKK